MKKAFFISLLTLIISASYGQSIVTSNKLWYNIIYKYTHPYPTIGTEIIKFSYDTIINSLTYKKVERSLDESQMEWFSYGYIRENSSKQIFYKYYPLETERLLYNLNVQLHDTILVYNLRTYLGEYLEMEPMTLYVNLIDSVLIGERYQKRINLGGYPDDSLTIWSQWTDSTGSMGGMLHNRDREIILDAYSLVCYFEDGILKFHDTTYQSCYNPTDIYEKQNLIPLVTIYPNPITCASILTVTGLEDIYSLSIRFYNLLGKEVLYRDGEKRIEINKNDFPSGIYFYCLTINHKNFKAGKIIIN